MAKQKKDKRIVFLSIVLAVIMFGYSFRLFDWQILDRQNHINDSLAATAIYTDIPASRGEVLDRYGRPFAVNAEGYNIIFNRIYMPKDNLNDTILSLVEILNAAGEKYNDRCPISKTEPYKFEEISNITPATMISELKLAHYATVENCVAEMIKQFKLENYSKAEQRIIMGVRLTMIVADYSDPIPFTFAENVSIDTVSKIEEYSAKYPGVETSVVTVRQYVSGAIAPHIIGYIGPIYAEEWDDLKDKGYSYNDQVGKSGIEKYSESYLRGTNGTLKTTRDSSGKVLSTEVVKEPVAGNTVMLTLDRNLQEVAQKSLKELIEFRQTQKDSPSCDAGSIVVMNVNTAEILAAVTYPSYDMETYRNDYDSLLKNADLPLFNRAFNGVYAPGSTFKPVTAAIGLELNKITPDESIVCQGTYTYFKDYQPSCMHIHGALANTKALEVSCNYYFYELGRRIGIDKLNEYCRKFGLGVATGVELGEATGTLAGPEHRQSIGSYWTEGDTIQAAIGQSDNGFTPLQLATYTSTIANGGTRYKSHIIKEIRSYDLEKVVEKFEPTIVENTGISANVIDVVKKGMLSVTSEGTASLVFNNYPIQVGGKTGTATTFYDGVEYNNGIFIAFAPYDKPEIAVAIIGEKAGYGSGCASPAYDIFDAYFFYKGEIYNPQKSGVLTE